MSYLRRVPAKDAVIGNKRVTPPEWGSGPDAGYFVIPAFTRQEWIEPVRAAHTTRVTGADGRTSEETDNAAFVRAVVQAHLKGWGNILDPETDQPIPFTPEEVAALPDDVQVFLFTAILDAGKGLLSGRDVITKDEVTGAPLDRKSPDAQVPGGDAQAV